MIQKDMLIEIMTLKRIISNQGKQLYDAHLKIEQIEKLKDIINTKISENK